MDATANKTEQRLWTVVVGICLALGGWWLQNTWQSIEKERAAREALMLVIAQTYVTKDAISIITQAREKQVQAIIDRIERNTDRLINIESDLRNTRETMFGIKTEHAALQAKVDALAKQEATESHGKAEP